MVINAPQTVGCLQIRAAHKHGDCRGVLGVSGEVHSSRVLSVYLL